ncbi:MAG: hypothetical protein JKY87_02410 [Mariprofundus sp.]|nr:hypothetical protein [Mariprofundus sp.]
MKKFLMGAVLALALIPALPQTSDARMHGADRLYYDALVAFYTDPTSANMDTLIFADFDALVAAPVPDVYAIYRTNQLNTADFLFTFLSPFIITTAGAPASPL